MLSNRLLAAIAALLVTISFSACRTQKAINRNYINDLRDSTHSRIWQAHELRIQKRDRLSIYVTALNPQSAAIFNLSGGTTSAEAASAYNVDENGDILFPQLGYIHVEGYTKFQLRDTLMNRLRKYLNDPLVVVDFTDVKITVLGEVAQQGPLPLSGGRITLLEALGQAGNVTASGRRDSILVIREENDQRKFGYVNLLSNEAFKSEYFMLQQNDVVYVPMTEKKATARDASDRTTIERALPYITVITSMSSVIWLIYNIVR